MILEFIWTKATTTSWTATHEDFMLKKKQFPNSERYEIWRGKELLVNDLTYFELLSALNTKRARGVDLSPKTKKKYFGE